MENLTQSNNGKVAIIVVTFNRLKDLKICINAIREQSYPNYDIIVINNGSTDGTKEYLDTQSDIIAIHQKNVGGAGGFYTGMKYMYDHDYQWLLMMDDDGIPEKDELKTLLSKYEHIYALNNNKDIILNALVVNKEDHNTISFLWERGSHRSIYVKDLQSENYIEDIHPFNGTLIKRNIIEQIGFIKKEMFIWGDEEEYISRARHHGFKTYTIPQAIHYHPKEKGVKGYLIPFVKKYYILKKPIAMSHYYYRNKGYIYNTYPEKKKHIIPFLLANTVYHLLRMNIKELIKLYKYFYLGKKNRY